MNPPVADNRSAVDISVLIPVFNEAGSLRELHTRLVRVLEGLGCSFEILFVNDGSTDGSREVLESLYHEDQRVRVVNFRRNFGKSAALDAGFRRIRGELVFTMDADLQDDPEEIPSFLEKLAEGHDLVSGWKFKRHDPLSKTLPSKVFNLMTSWFSGLRLHDFNCGFKLYKAQVVRELRIYGELHRYIPALAHFKGFRVTEKKVVHHPRRHGVSKFGASRLVRGYLDLITVTFLNRYTRRPLHFFGPPGTILCLIGIAIGCYFAGYWVVYHHIGGRVPLLLLAVFLMLSGIQLISTGLIGEMLISSHKSEEPGYQVTEVLERDSGE